MQRSRFVSLSFIAALLMGNGAFAQLAYSPFTDGAVAYVALTGPGVSFARGNPASLAWLQNQKVSFSVESNLDQLDAPFKGFNLQVAAASRLVLGVGRWERTATTGMMARRARAFIDPHPLSVVSFGYRQNWSYGLGLRLTRNFALGAAMREEEYSTSSFYDLSLVAKKEYQVFDFGVNYTSDRLNLGVVYRGWRSGRNDDASNFHVSYRLQDGSTFTWKPVAFPQLQFAPEEAWEGGFLLQAHSRVQVLGEANSREEYAVGVRGHIIAGLALTGGRGERYDRIYNASTVRYNALGALYQHESFAVAFTWIIPRQSARNHNLDIEYGRFDFRPFTNHQVLLGVNVRR